ncbi:MAG: NUDIX domain-containing protein, partial [Halobacteriota archaeon]
HVNALISDLVAEYGEIDLVGRRVECSYEEYDGLLDSFESFGVVGGAGVRIVRDGRVLLVRYEHAEGWIDPGDGRRPGESYVECAKRGVEETTGLEASIDGLAQIQLVYLDDSTGRPPIPNPYVSFFGSVVDDAVSPGDSAVAVRWADELPAELAYDELAELRLDG